LSTDPASAGITAPPGPTPPAPGGLSFQHVWLIAAYGIRFALRTGGGLIFILLLLLAGLGVAGTFISPVEMMADQAEGEGLDSREAVNEILESDQVKGAVQWVTGTDDEEAEYLLRDQPALLSAILVILLLLIPFLACVGAFNQTAGDIGSRGLRYLLLRTERENIFLGRFLGTVLFTAVTSFCLLLLVFLYVQLKLGLYPTGRFATWSFQGFVAVLFLALPYVALCSWMSGMLDSAFASLSICLLVAGFPIVFLKIVEVGFRSQADLDLPWLVRILPWGWRYDLLSGDFATRMLGYSVMLAFTAAFLALGLRAFRKRDL